jgi:hypothetical protein
MRSMKRGLKRHGGGEPSSFNLADEVREKRKRPEFGYGLL